MAPRPTPLDPNHTNSLLPPLPFAIPSPPPAPPKCRSELVAGKSEPHAEELEGYAGPRDHAAAAGKGKGLPAFWLNVLLAQVGSAEKCRRQQTCTITGHPPPPQERSTRAAPHTFSGSSPPFPQAHRDAAACFYTPPPPPWTTLACMQDLLGGHITRRDRQALEKLADVRFETGARGMLVEFHFLENPFFENKVRA